jgi:CHAP domain-containing protein
MNWSSLLRFFGAPAPVPPYPAEPNPSIYAEAVLKVAIRELGHGEKGGNNVGPDLDRYRRGGPGGAWCAAFISYCLEEGAKDCGIPWLVKRSHSAKTLFANALKVGTKVTRPMARDLASWHRGVAGARTGHIGIVSRVDGNAFWSIEGNKGLYPSMVREYLHELGEPLLLAFARLP